MNKKGPRTEMLRQLRAMPYAEAVRAWAAFLCEQDDALSSARDAALEEVATKADRRASLARRVYVGTEKAAVGDGAGSALETLAADLRASKSSPVSVLPVDKVREVLRAARGIHGANVDEVLTTCAEVLGVDLDAKAESSGRERLATMTGVPEHLIYDEPAHEPTPGVCKGCDAPENAPPEQHRFSCTVHGKRGLRLNATVRDDVLTVGCLANPGGPHLWGSVRNEERCLYCDAMK